MGLSACLITVRPLNDWRNLNTGNGHMMKNLFGDRAKRLKPLTLVAMNCR